MGYAVGRLRAAQCSSGIRSRSSARTRCEPQGSTPQLARPRASVSLLGSAHAAHASSWTWSARVVFGAGWSRIDPLALAVSDERQFAKRGTQERGGGAARRFWQEFCAGPERKKRDRPRFFWSLICSRAPHRSARHAWCGGERVGGGAGAEATDRGSGRSVGESPGDNKRMLVITAVITNICARRALVLHVVRP